MICPVCDGCGESLTGRTGEGVCQYCKGRGAVPDYCDRCGELAQCNEDGLCEECQAEKEVEDE